MIYSEQNDQAFNIQRVPFKKEKAFQEKQTFCQKIDSDLNQNAQLNCNLEQTKQIFHSSFQNTMNQNNFQFLNSFKNDQKAKHLESTNLRFTGIQEQKSVDQIQAQNANFTSEKSQQFIQQINQKLQPSQSLNIYSKNGNQQSNQYNFNQASYLNQINGTQQEQQRVSYPTENSYLEYAKQIIKQSDEQLQHLQRITPSKRQSQERQKKTQNLISNQIKSLQESNMYQKLILEESITHTTSSKLKLVDCSPLKQTKKSVKSKLNFTKKSTEKQIDEDNLEQSKYIKRTKNRPKSSGFLNQQSQTLKKKSSRIIHEQTINQDKLLERSQQSLSNSTLQKKQRKNNQLDSSQIQIQQYGSPDKTNKSLQKFIINKEQVKQSLFQKKQSKESFQKQSSMHEIKVKHNKQNNKDFESSVRMKLAVSQSTNNFTKNTTLRCKTALKQSSKESFVEQKVKIMQEEYLKSQTKSSFKDYNQQSKKNMVILQQSREDKFGNKKKKSNAREIISNSKQINPKQSKSSQFVNQNIKSDDKILNILRQSLQSAYNNEFDQVNAKQKLSNKIEQLGTKKSNIKIQKNDSAKSYKKMDFKINNYNQNDYYEDTYQTNKSLMQIKFNQNENTYNSQSTEKQNSKKFENSINSHKKSQIEQTFKEVEIKIKNYPSELQKEARKSIDEYKQKKQQAYSHIKIITKPTENVVNEISKGNATRQSQQILADLLANKKSVQSPQKNKSQETQQKLILIYQKLGAVLIGYKTRRIYNKSKLVKQDRFEFRDLIQFAYSLKQELSQLQQQQKEPFSPVKHITNQEQSTLDFQIDQTKKLLLQSLKDLIQKRQQFSIHFNRLLEGGAEWLYESKYTVRSKNCNTPDNKQIQRNYLKKSQSLEPLSESNYIIKKQSQVQSPNKMKSNQKCNKTVTSPSQNDMINSPFKESFKQSEKIHNNLRMQKFQNNLKAYTNQTESSNFKIKNPFEQNNLKIDDIQQNSNLNIMKYQNQSDNLQQNNKPKLSEIKEQIKTNSVQQDFKTIKNDFSIENQDHINKQIQQKKRQISQLTFGESADINIVNQSRTESLLNGAKKLQADKIFKSKSGLQSNNSINEDNIVKFMSNDSPSKKFQSLKNNKYYCYNSIQESPNKNEQSNFNSKKINNSSFINHKSNIGSPKRVSEQQMFEPCIIKENSIQLLNMNKERDQFTDDQEYIDDEAHIQLQNQNSTKKNFLRKGEKSRSCFDPQKSIKNQKINKIKQDQSNDCNNQKILQNNQNHFLSQQNIEINEKSTTHQQKSANKSNDTRYSKNDRSLTPKSHKKVLNHFIKSYQSPYQQNSSNLNLKSTKQLEDNDVETKIKQDQQEAGKKQQKSLLRNDLRKRQANIQQQQQSQDQFQQNSQQISININQQNAQDEKRLSINFVSRIPRLTSGTTSVRISQNQKTYSPVKIPQNKINNLENQQNNDNTSTSPQKQIIVNSQKKRTYHKYMQRQKSSIFSKQTSQSGIYQNNCDFKSSDLNQTSQQSSFIERGSNRKHSNIENQKSLTTNHASSQQKNENLLQINEMIKKQNLQYLQGLSQGKQVNKQLKNNSNLSNQELSCELNKIRQSLVLKNLVVQKGSQHITESKKLFNQIKNVNNDQFSENNFQSSQNILNTKQKEYQCEFSKLSISTSKKLLQTSKSKPSNRYHEKSESDASAFSQINNNNFEIIKKDIFNEIPIILQEEQKQNLNQQTIQSPISANQKSTVRFQETFEKKSYQNNYDDTIQQNNQLKQETSPSIRDIAEYQQSSPYNISTKRVITKLENLTPIKNMNFENQYVANLKRKKTDSNSPKRPDFLKKTQKPEFSINLQCFNNDLQPANNKLFEQIQENQQSISLDQHLNNEVIDGNEDLQGQEGFTISMFDNKKCCLSSNYQSQQSSFQKNQNPNQGIQQYSQDYSENQKNNEQENIMQAKQKQLPKNKENQYSRFINHQSNQNSTQQVVVQDKDTGTFRIQPLKINSVANTSSNMSSIRGDIIITQANKEAYYPIQSINHTKYNSVYDMISPSIINPCCTESIHKYNQSPSAKSQSPFQKLSSPCKIDDNSFNGEQSPLKQCSGRKLNQQQKNKENIISEQLQYYERVESIKVGQGIQNLNVLNEAENNIFLKPQIIQGKQNTVSVLGFNQINESQYDSQKSQLLNSSISRSQGTEGRRRSRGDRNLKNNKPSIQIKNNCQQNQKNAQVQNQTTQNPGQKRNSNLNQYQQEQKLTQNSLEVPDINVPKALPTPQRHDYKTNLSSVETPIKKNYDDEQTASNFNKTISCKSIQFQAQHPSCSKNENVKRLTQQKKSQERVKGMKSNSPFKTPQKQIVYPKEFSEATSSLYKQKTNQRSINKNSKFVVNSTEKELPKNLEEDAIKIDETLQQLKQLLYHLKIQETNQQMTEHHSAKSRQIEEMITNLQQQQKMVQQYIQEYQFQNKSSQMRI